MREFEKVKSYLDSEDFPCSIEVNDKPESDTDLDKI